jgi:hypothetical protein
MNGRTKERPKRLWNGRRRNKDERWMTGFDEMIPDPVRVMARPR